MFSNDAIGGRPREGRWKAAGKWVTCTTSTLRSPVPTRTTPALGEHLRHLPRVRAERYTGHYRRTLKGTTSLRKAQGAWPNRSVRVQASHCTDRLASLRLPTRMGTSDEVTPSTRPRVCRHRLASYISNGVRLAVVYQCFEAIVSAFLFALSYAITLALCNPHRLHKARAPPWVEVVCGESGKGDNCSPELLLLYVLVCWCLPGGRRGVTRARLTWRVRLVISASRT